MDYQRFQELKKQCKNKVNMQKNLRNEKQFMTKVCRTYGVSSEDHSKARQRHNQLNQEIALLGNEIRVMQEAIYLKKQLYKITNS